jgi:hypothetical protein
MSAQPDPQLVREIAREHIRSGRPDLGITIELMLIGRVLDREELAAWEDAVRQAIRTAAVTWPDERAQDKLDVTLDGRLAAARAFLKALRKDANSLHEPCPHFYGTECRCGELWPCVVQAQLRAGVADCEAALAEQDVTLDGLIDAAHRRRPGFDEDVRAVAALLNVRADGASMDECKHAFNDLHARFAGRIAELEARTTDGGTQ